jgi:hypothetical protein
MLLILHKLISEQHKELADLSKFDTSSLSARAASLLQHLIKNPHMCVITSLGGYGFSMAIQAGNEALGFQVTSSSVIQVTSLTNTVQSAVLGVACSYPILQFVHHASIIVFDKLDQQDQNILKHLFALAHDFASSLAYSNIGSGVNKAELNNFINIGAPILTLVAILIVFVAERYYGHPVIGPLVSREAYNAYVDAVDCCNVLKKAPAREILHDIEEGVPESFAATYGATNQAPAILRSYETTLNKTTSPAPKQAPNNSASKAARPTVTATI